MAAWMFYMLKINGIAAVIIALTVLLSRLTKRRYSLKWKYHVWLAVSLFLLLPLKLPFGNSIRIQIDRPEAIRPARQAEQFADLATQEAERTGGQPVQEAERTGGQPVQETERAGDQPAQEERPSGQSAQHLADRSAQQAKTGTSDAYTALLADAQGGSSRVLHISSDRVSFYGLLQLFWLIWLAGFLILAVVRALCCRYSLYKLRRWSYPVTDRKTLELYRYLCLKKHIRRPPGLFISPELSTPVLAGLCHTGLYLTEEPYDFEELNFILSHELTHYRRGDLWYKMLLMAAGTVHWFNPALLWMRSEAEKDIENLCDGSVVEHYTNEEQMRYSRLLLKTAALQNRVPYLAASLNDSTLIFKERILYMRNLRRLKKNAAVTAALLAVMVSAQLFTSTAVGESERTAGNAALADGSGDATSDWQEPAGLAGFSKAAGGTESFAQAQNGRPDGAAGSPASGTGNAPGNGAASNSVAAGVTANEAAGNLKDSAGDGFAADAAGSPADGAENLQSGEAAEAEGSGDAGERTVEPADFSVWVSSRQVNVRSAGSTDAPVLGTAYFMDAMEVTGIEERGGAPTGWYQVSCHGMTGYVSADCLTQEPSTAETLGLELTSEQTTLYSGDGMSATYINRATDGDWYDGSGRPYQENGDGTWKQLISGETWTETAPPNPADHAVSQQSVIDADGLNGQTLYQQSDGSWQNGARGVYTANGDGTWNGPDGEIWYAN